MINIVNAQPPFQTSFGETGGKIFYPDVEYLPYNEYFNFHIHVTNITNQAQINNTDLDCYLHIYNTSGDHIFESNILNKDSNGWDHQILLLPGNFTDLGLNSAFVWCNGTSNAEVKINWIVNISGEEKTLANLFGNIFLVLALGFIIFSLSWKYGKTDFKAKRSSIIDSHEKWGTTFVKSFLHGIMEFSFIWYYFLGWIMLFLIKEIVMTFNSLEIYKYFILILDIYSIGFLLMFAIWVGFMIKFFNIITESIDDINKGIN